MKYMIFILFCFILCVHGQSCKDILKGLSKQYADFTQCASKHAVPVTFCEMCKNESAQITKWYNALKGVDSKNISCKELYFDKDRLNIIERIYEDLSGLWEKAYCQECVNDFNETTEIYREITDFQTCLDNSKKDPCNNCKDKYVNMNNLYNDIIKRYDGKVCFDIQDKMNRSRVIWSKDLNCCKRESNLVAFAAVSSALMILPILFFGGLIIKTRRAERNHQTLDNNNAGENTTNIRSNTNPQLENSRSEITRILPAQNIPSTSLPKKSSSNIASKKKKLISDSSDSSDEDPLLGSSCKQEKLSNEASKKKQLNIDSVQSSDDDLLI